jgi:hypothetical protein
MSTCRHRARERTDTTVSSGRRSAGGAAHPAPSFSGGADVVSPEGCKGTTRVPEIGHANASQWCNRSNHWALDVRRHALDATSHTHNYEGNVGAAEMRRITSYDQPAMQTATENRKGNYTSTPIYDYRYTTYMANTPPVYIYLTLLLLRVKVASEHRLVRKERVLDHAMYVQEQPREPTSEVRKEAVRHSPNVSLHVLGKVLIVVLLRASVSPVFRQTPNR